MDHDHCQNCVFANCTSRENDCPVQQCPNGCGAALHRCKIEEHTAHTCLEVRTPCVNAVYGCEETPKRWASRNHLEHCPASTLMCRFPYRVCNKIVRRDEFSAHWKSFHLDIQANFMLVERCPMYSYGCNYEEQRLVPNPPGTTVDYDKERGTVFVKPPEVVTDSTKEFEGAGDYAAKLQKQRELALYGYGDELEESLDVLGQLPVEVLTAICHYLDSMSLCQLSQVNHYIRKICLNTVKKKGIVFHRWVRDEVTKQWLPGPKVSRNFESSRFEQCCLTTVVDHSTGCCQSLLACMESCYHIQQRLFLSRCRPGRSQESFLPFPPGLLPTRRRWVTT